MNHTALKRQQGNALVHFMCAISLGGAMWVFAFFYLEQFEIKMPWGVIVLAASPMAYALTLMHKLSESRKSLTKYLSRTEQSRLTSIIRSKNRKTIFLIILQLVMTVLMVLIFLLLESDVHDAFPYTKYLAPSGLSLLCISLYSVVPLNLNVQEIAEFEAKLESRAQQAKRRKNALEKLKPKNK
jgi:hypothetical protein